MSFLFSKVPLIKEELNYHGIICVKNCALSSKELVDFAAQIGDELLPFPGEMTFGNVEPGFPNISRVGNINFDGTLRENT